MFPEKVKEWFWKEVAEVRRVPVTCAAACAIGIAVGWYVTSVFYAERFSVMEERLKQAQEAPKGNQQATATVAGGESVLTQWGAGVPRTCGGIVNRQPLAKHADKYDVVIACGFGLPNVDKYADQAISLSPKYSLRELAQIVLAIPVSEAMRSSLAAFATREHQSTPVDKQAGLRFNVGVWYEVLLVPREVLVSDIKSLADVRRLGGEVMQDQTRGIIAQGLTLEAVR